MADKILFVEDDPSQATLVTLELKRRGFAVTAARNATEALGKLSRDVFDLVLTDLKLGDQDGMDVLAAAKREQPDAEVVVITGHGSITAAVAAIKNGAFDFLTKPIESEQLALTLQKAL